MENKWQPITDIKDIPHKTLLMLKSPILKPFSSERQYGLGILETFVGATPPIEIWAHFVLEKKGQLFMTAAPDDMTGWSFQIFPKD